MTKQIPRNLKLPNFTKEEIREITIIVFGLPVDVKPCDVIFVFGSIYPELYKITSQAYNSGFGKHVVVTGGYKNNRLKHPTWDNNKKSEADIIVKELTSRGVPQNSISYENRSKNSLENVLFAMEVYNFNKVRSILAICKTYAVGRQCRTLQRHLPQPTIVIPLPYEIRISRKVQSINRNNWMDHEVSKSYVWGNFLRILHYGEKGHLVFPDKISPNLLNKSQAYLATL